MKLLILLACLAVCIYGKSLVKRDIDDVHDELEDRVREYRDKCYPKPGSGCRCVEENDEGEEELVKYNTDEECYEEDHDHGNHHNHDGNDHSGHDHHDDDDWLMRVKRSITRKQAKANYDLVVQELNNRFANYLENCFPRPKGCLCVIGKDAAGRDLTERRKNDRDCKSKPTRGKKRKHGNN